jgi:arsenate reductase
MRLNPELQTLAGQLAKEFGAISPERKSELELLAHFVEQRVSGDEQAELNFICTHNSRRSHIAQLWAQASASYFGVENVTCYSGGTEATAFNPRAVKAMRGAGFSIKMTADGHNPVYEVSFSDGAPSVSVFSKKYDDAVNPKKGFGAVMTCSHADQNCPIVSGAASRFPITYEDPKDFDGTPMEDDAYRERVRQIGREMLFAFSLIKPAG